MISNDTFTKGRRWLFWLFLKVNLFFISLFFIFEGLLLQDLIFLGIGFILIIVSGSLIYRDAKQDPYNFIKLFYIQMLLWWKLRGPLQTNKPYIIHFPESGHLNLGNLVKTISVKKETLIQGKSLLVNVKTVEICSECNGRRSKPLSVQIECKKCQNGRNYFSLNMMKIPIPCTDCLGTGWIPVHPCPTCNGNGSFWRNRNIKVQIPPYSKPGTKLRIPKLGKVNPKTLHQSDLFLKLRERFLNIF